MFWWFRRSSNVVKMDINYPRKKGECVQWNPKKCGCGLCLAPSGQWILGNWYFSHCQWKVWKMEKDLCQIFRIYPHQQNQRVCFIHQELTLLIFIVRTNLTKQRSSSIFGHRQIWWWSADRWVSSKNNVVTLFSLIWMSLRDLILYLICTPIDI